MMIHKNWFIVAFALSLAVPTYGDLLDNNIVMSGVVEEAEEVAMSIETLEDGSYQKFLNNKWEAVFPGRMALLRVRNQMLYYAQVSPNSNVVIGKDKCLFEPGYIFDEIQVDAPAPEEYLSDLGDKLSRLNEIMNVTGKELYVFITPSKARFCRDKIPFAYIVLDAEEDYAYNNYSKLVETLKNNNICFFDSINYIENNLHQIGLESPIFYSTGTHWSHCWGGICAIEFLKYMDGHSKYDLSLLEMNENVSSEPIFPDTDLYDSLNLIMPAEQDWYEADFIKIKEGKDEPNVFLRGGSFMGQSLGQLVSSGIFGENVHFENNHYHTNDYSTIDYISTFRSYEEMDMKALIGPSDIVVLEVNEAVIDEMSWGFIDYLLEHPQFLEE